MDPGRDLVVRVARPGDRTGEPDPTVGHLRHFVTQSDCAPRGIGPAVFAHCLTDGLAAGVRVFECQSTLTAERFYRALGFELLGPTTALLGGRLAFPGLPLAAPLGGGGMPAARCRTHADHLLPRCGVMLMTSADHAPIAVRELAGDATWATLQAEADRTKHFGFGCSIARRGRGRFGAQRTGSPAERP